MSEDPRVPLSPARHGRLRWRRFDSYDFVRPLREVPVVAAEAEPVAAAMPLLFRRTAEGIVPVALLRMVPGGPSPFVSPAGLWLAAYVPSLIRVHPFSARAAGEGRMMLMVDESSGLLTEDPADELFFGPDGTPAPALAELVGFFREREASALRTSAACARLGALDLLVPFVPAGAGDAPETAWQGLAVVDRARFEALGDEAWLELRRLGGLGLVHAHFVSLAQVPWLLRAEAVRDGEAAAPPKVPAPSGPDVSEFLAALATSHQNDAGLGEMIGRAARGRDGG